MFNRAPSSEDAARYFDKQAADYGTRSISGFWKFVRAHEADSVLKMIGDPAGHRFIDLGSGAGYYSMLFAERGAASVHAVDLSEAMIKALPAPVQGVVGDIASCDVGRQFSRIVCAGALEFVDDPQNVFKNALRHAAPGARFVTLVPNAGIIGRLYKRFHRRHGLVIRLFSRTDLAEFAKSSGWEIEKISSILPFALVGAFRKPD